MNRKQAEQLYRQAGVEPPADIASVPLPNKFSAKKKEIDGITFASSLEARAYQVLKLWETAETVSELKLQPEFVLSEGFRDANGKWNRPIKYVADFSFCDADGRTIVDVKGMKTPVFRMKEKMFRAKFPDIKLLIWDRAKVASLCR